MTVRTIVPARLRGRAVAPPSKSYTHRALVVGFLGRRRYVVTAPLDSDDTRATALALRGLGADVTFGRRRWTVTPRSRRASVRIKTIDCGESGTTLRLTTALAALADRPVRFRGRGRLAHRPMRPLVEALSSLGASVRPSTGRVPFTVRGPIHGGEVRLDASESSQFASALLFALPTVLDDSRLRLQGPIVSEPYLNATIAVLRWSGVRVGRRGREIHIPGQQPFQGSTFTVPGDASSAAYLWSAAALGGGPVAVSGVDRTWPQADLAILDLLREAGARVEERRDSITVRRGTPRPFSVDLTASPDLYPLAGVIAASTPGLSRLRGAAHVVHKESDRRAETARLASAFGARVRAVGDGLSITGTSHPKAVELPDLSDHRLVMSAAVGALAASGPSRIGSAEAVGKSFPGFWQTLADLGAAEGAP